MPTYEYRCHSCERTFDVFQKMSDPPSASCPSCGSEAERLISAGAGLLFKGSGFYITDHRSSEYRESAKADASAADSGSSSSSGGGSSAPASSAPSSGAASASVAPSGSDKGTN